MKTLAFIGSDKNAGKTTAMNLVASKLMLPLCFSSIGLNGEEQDNLTGCSKPKIKVPAGQYFLTATDHLKNRSGSYQIISIFGLPHFLKTFVLARAKKDLELILEGPNDKDGWIKAKKEIGKILKKGALLIDGSIDRQFIAHPEISDSFYFSLLLSPRKDQQEKAKMLLAPINLDQCNPKIKQKIKSLNARSIVFNKKNAPQYLGDKIPFLDEELLQQLNVIPTPTLYLEGALTTSFARKLSMVSELSIVLNNFTLYQCEQNNLKISLLFPVNVESIFIKEEEYCEITIPKGIGVTNIFRESVDEIAI